jgi:tRNA threonylcarbamoyladenosine biosynthesis protein TsaB
MILLLDTSTPTCRLTLIDGDHRVDAAWLADRNLAHGLLEYLSNQLQAQGKSWTDLTGLGVFQGPGSFTGLRIGLTVLNTMADSLDIPIVAGIGQAWQEQVLAKLSAGANDRLVLPVYGRPARITAPRK